MGTRSHACTRFLFSSVHTLEFLQQPAVLQAAHYVN